MKGYIYIIKLRENIKNKEEIFKIGRTENILRRTRQYPKGSALLYTKYTDNIIEKEKIIINKLSDNVAKEYGLEYFQCDLNIIESTIDSVVNLIDCENVEEKYNEKIIENDNNQKMIIAEDKINQKRIKHQKIVSNVKEFYENIILFDSIKEYKIYDIHRQYNNWNNHEFDVSLYIFSKLLKDLGGKIQVKKINNEASKIISFEHLYNKIDKEEEQVKNTNNTDVTVKNWLINNYNITDNAKDRIGSTNLLDACKKNNIDVKLSSSKFKQILQSIGVEHCRSNGKTDFKKIKAKDL